MKGVITGRHLVAHGPLIVRQFGWKAYVRCVVRWLRHPSRETFLHAMCAMR